MLSNDNKTNSRRLSAEELHQESRGIIPLIAVYGKPFGKSTGRCPTVKGRGVSIGALSLTHG